MNLNSLYRHFAQSKESGWIMKPYNAELLYDFVKKHPVKQVLDLGTGIGLSAAVIALAFKDKGETDYHIDSVEQYDKCIRLAKELIPAELQTNLTIHRADVIPWQHEQIPYQYFSIYDWLPSGDYDLIINDGPAPFLEGESWVDLPNGTVIKLLVEDKIKPGAFVAWDGRLHMIKYVEKYFSSNFYLYRSMQRPDDFNVLERKDNPPEFKDSLLEAMKQTTYFDNL